MFLEIDGEFFDDQRTPIERGFGKTQEFEQKDFEERKKNGDFLMPLEQMPYLEGENEEEIKKIINKGRFQDLQTE